MATKTQYRVVNTNSGEALTDWTDSLAAAHRQAEDCEQHETEPECKVASREIDMHEEMERVEAAYRAAGLMRGPCGVVVRCDRFSIFVADEQHTENYDDANQAIADVENWKS